MVIESHGKAGRAALVGPDGSGWPALHSGLSAVTLVTSIEGLLR